MCPVLNQTVLRHVVESLVMPGLYWAGDYQGEFVWVEKPRQAITYNNPTSAEDAAEYITSCGHKAQAAKVLFAIEAQTEEDA